MIGSLRWILILAVYIAMIGLSAYWFDQGGMFGLGAGALGFVMGYLAPGQTSVGERLGNGYVGSLAGLCIGFAAGGLAHWLAPYMFKLEAR